MLGDIITGEAVEAMRVAAAEIEDPELRAQALRTADTWQEYLDHQANRARLIAEAANRGDWDEALLLCESEERGPILARAGEELDGDDLRKVLADWWSVTEAWGGNPEVREGVMNALRKVAPVIVPGRLQTPPEGWFRVYRGNLGETPSGGSWSLARETAEFFARMAAGPRGQIVLGMTGPGPAAVWQAWVHSKDVLGFFDDRSEYEIVTDVVTGVEKIAELVTVEDAS